MSSRPQRLDEVFLRAGVDERHGIGESREQVAADPRVAAELEELREALDLQEHRVGEHGRAVRLEQRQKAIEGVLGECHVRVTPGATSIR